MNQQPVPFETILDDCLTAVLDHDRPAEACLQQYPAQQAALEPLLQLSKRLQIARAVQPDPEFMQAAAARMQNMILARPRQPQIAPQREEPSAAFWSKIAALFAPRQRLAWARVVAAVCLLWLSLGVVTVWAASESLPGQTLYPVKLLIEDARLRVTNDPLRQAQLHLARAERRLRETAVLLENENTDNLPDTLTAYQTEIETAVAFLGAEADLTAPEKEALAQTLITDLAYHETLLTEWQAGLPLMNDLINQALELSRESIATALGILGEVEQALPEPPVSLPLPVLTGTPELPIPTPAWELPPFWPEACPSPLDWPEEWPEGCPIPADWPPDWPEPPGGWPVLPLLEGTLEPPAGWTPPPYWPPECPVPQKWPFSWPEGCVLPTGYPPDWTPPPGGWPELATPLPLPTLTVPDGWPAECPLPPDWPEEWESWPTDCEIPTDFEWPADWPELPEGWPNLPDDGWVDSPDQLPPPPTEFPEAPDEMPPPGEWPTPPPDDGGPPGWPWP